ncbi:MAG: MFS transporter, partial [Chloroflexia bacterium]
MHQEAASHPGRRGPFAGLTANIRVQVLTSFLGGFYQGAIAAVRQPFALFLWNSEFFLGLLETVGGWGGAVSSLAQLLGGWLADRVGRRPVLIAASLCNALWLLTFTLAALFRLWWLLIPGMALAGLGMVGRAAGSSLTAESAPPERRGVAYSLIMFAFIAPGVFSSILGGQVSERWGYLPVMATALVLEALVLLLFIRFLRETLQGPRGRFCRQDLLSLVRLFTIPRRLWKFVLPLGLDSFCWGLALSLLFGLLKKAHHFGDGELGWVNAFFSLAWALAQLPVGRLVDRHGCRRFLLLSEALSVLCGVILLLWPTFVGVSVGYALFGLSAALWVPALLKWLAGSLPEAERGESLGRVFTIQGLARIPTPYIAAWLFHRWGYPAPLLAAL